MKNNISRKSFFLSNCCGKAEADIIGHLLSNHTIYSTDGLTGRIFSREKKIKYLADVLSVSRQTIYTTLDYLANINMLRRFGNGIELGFWDKTKGKSIYFHEIIDLERRLYQAMKLANYHPQLTVEQFFLKLWGISYTDLKTTLEGHSIALSAILILDLCFVLSRKYGVFVKYERYFLQLALSAYRGTLQNITSKKSLKITVLNDKFCLEETDSDKLSKYKFDGVPCDFKRLYHLKRYLPKKDKLKNKLIIAELIDGFRKADMGGRFRDYRKSVGDGNKNIDNEEYEVNYSTDDKKQRQKYDAQQRQKEYMENITWDEWKLSEPEKWNAKEMLGYYFYKYRELFRKEHDLMVKLNHLSVEDAFKLKCWIHSKGKGAFKKFGTKKTKSKEYIDWCEKHGMEFDKVISEENINKFLNHKKEEQFDLQKEIDEATEASKKKKKITYLHDEEIEKYIRKEKA
jgi:hypothetical protein